jgi:hypothetical protein
MTPAGSRHKRKAIAAMQHNDYPEPMYQSDSTPSGAPVGPAPTLFEAIVTQRCVEATYNGGEVVLSPHVAFVRHGEIYVGATTVERDGNPPREVKIGIFKLDGLAGLRLSGRKFVPSSVYDPHDERFGEGTLVAVETAG